VVAITFVAENLARDGERLAQFKRETTTVSGPRGGHSRA
jgi:hypothetical protein